MMILFTIYIVSVCFAPAFVRTVSAFCKKKTAEAGFRLHFFKMITALQAGHFQG